MRYHKTGTFKCSVCPKSYAYPPSLNCHIKKKHEFGKTYRCRVWTLISESETLQDQAEHSKTHQDKRKSVQV